MTFQLHPQLAADTLNIGEMGPSTLLLMNDARYPWVILVPQIADLRELHQLPGADRAEVLEQIVHLSATMDELFKADKINVGALGNLVPQLHIHIIARSRSDHAWPRPVWGVGDAVPYSEPLKTARLELIRSVLPL